MNDGWIDGWVGGWVGGWVDGYLFADYMMLLQLNAFNAINYCKKIQAVYPQCVELLGFFTSDDHTPIPIVY